MASRRFRRLPDVFLTFPTASRRFRRLPDVSDGSLIFRTASRRFRWLPDVSDLSDGFPTFRIRPLPDFSDGFPTLGPSRALGLPSFEGPSVSFPTCFRRQTLTRAVLIGTQLAHKYKL